MRRLGGRNGVVPFAHAHSRRQPPAHARGGYAGALDRFRGAPRQRPAAAIRRRQSRAGSRIPDLRPPDPLRLHARPGFRHGGLRPDRKLFPGEGPLRLEEPAILRRPAGRGLLQRLLQHERQHGGTPISFFPLQRNLMGMAVSPDSTAALRLQNVSSGKDRRRRTPRSGFSYRSATSSRARICPKNAHVRPRLGTRADPHPYAGAGRETASPPAWW